MINLNMNHYSLLRLEEHFVSLNNGQHFTMQAGSFQNLSSNWVRQWFKEICDQIWESVHSSHIHLSTLVTHIIYLEWQIDVKLSEIVELLFLCHPGEFQVFIPIRVAFMDLQMTKIGCVNYECYHKLMQSHVYLVINTHKGLYHFNRLPYGIA